MRSLLVAGRAASGRHCRGRLWVFPANSSDGALRVESRLPLGSIEFNYRAFSSPRWSPDGGLLGLVVTNGGTSWVEVFEANSGRLFYTSPPEHDTFSWTAARELKLGALEIHLSQTMTSSTVRHAYLDWVRGVAVLIMIEAHVLDAWTQAADRTRPLFGYAMILGGFGAPLFLFLAGLAVVLSAESKFRKTGDFAASWWAVQKRGWQVFGLAFLFRLQSYILSGGSSLLSLLKVDILNVMGPAIAMTALTGRMARKQGGARSAVCGGRLRHYRCSRRSSGSCRSSRGCPTQSSGISGRRLAVPTSRSFHGPGSCSRVPPWGWSSTASGRLNAPGASR